MGKKRGPAKKPEAEAESTDANDEPGSQEQDLYSVLGLQRSASQAEIKKAYHRMALQLHPDKNPDDQGAKEKFQTLQRVFSVLGDPEKRSIYDRTGSTEDAELSGEKFQNLYEYYRTVYRRVTAEDIARFEAEYRGSQEEAQDLKDLYVRFKGDMDKLFQCMLVSDESLDSHRFKDALEAAIDAGELKSFKVFKQWAVGVAKKPAPADPLRQKAQRSKGKGSARGEGDLMALIQSRQAERESGLFQSLAAKYGGKEKGAKGAKGGKKRVSAEPDISDEEFKKIQEGLLQKQKKPKTTR